MADYVIITRTGGPESPLKPETIITNSKEDILSTRTNSVYCVNNPFKVFREIQSDKRYAFVGLPCQLNRAKRNPAIKFIISLICNHTPKLEFTHEILSQLGILEHEVKQIEYRGSGWPGKFTAYLKNGEAKAISSGLVWNMRYMPVACKRCSEIGQDADIVVGDPWHLGIRDKNGFSLVICRNEEATRLVKEANTVKLKPIGIKELIKSQGKHFRRKFENQNH